MKEISQAALLQQWHPTTIPHMKFNELFRSTHPFTNVCEGNVNSWCLILYTLYIVRSVFVTPLMMYLDLVVYFNQL